MSVLLNSNGKIGIEAQFLSIKGIMTENTLRQNVVRRRIEVLQRAARNRPAIVSYDSLPVDVKKAVNDKLSSCVLEDLIRADIAAWNFFSSYKIGSKTLPPETIRKYYTNAMVLNAMYDMLLLCSDTGSITGGWFSLVCQKVLELDKDKYPHTLPTTVRRLRPIYNRYIKGGNKEYASLIHPNHRNQNSRKVTEDIKWLILALYCQKNNPYSDWVQEQYLSFIEGSIDVIDERNGELFNPKDFYKEGKPVMLSKTTVWNVISAPENQVIVNNIRMSFHKFGAKVRPHYHRNNARYSLSKVSLDDRDLPRKLHDGNRVKAYYAYDVCSGVLLGAAYSRKKNADLFIDCIREMFRTIDRLQLGLPLELEVENHIVRQYQEGMLKAGELFPFVRFCAPTNSQEKHAEQFNRQKKYGYEKRYQDGIGRWYALLPANQTEGERFYNEESDKYEIIEKTYDYDRLVADDIESIKAYNNGMHRDQKRYPGKSRMQVLLENLNPELTNINRALLLRYIGFSTVSSIRRNQYLQVQQANYQLSRVEILEKLKPNDYRVTAYWLPDDRGEIDRVYVYQDGRYVGEAKRIESFTTARAEWTEEDTEAMTEQAKYIGRFDKMVKAHSQRVAVVRTIQKCDYSELKSNVIDIDARTDKMENRDKVDINDLEKKFASEKYKKRGIEML